MTTKYSNYNITSSSSSFLRQRLNIYLVSVCLLSILWCVPACAQLVAHWKLDDNADNNTVSNAIITQHYDGNCASLFIDYTGTERDMLIQAKQAGVAGNSYSVRVVGSVSTPAILVGIYNATDVNIYARLITPYTTAAQIKAAWDACEAISSKLTLSFPTAPADLNAVYNFASKSRAYLSQGADPCDYGIPATLLIADINANVFGSWSREANLPWADTQHGCETCRSKIYVSGGLAYVPGQGAKEVNVLWVFDPCNPQAGWTVLNPNPYLVSQSHIFRCIDGNLYWIGGHNATIGVTSDNNCVLYDIDKNQWFKKTDMPLAIEDMGSAVFDGNIYVIGGLRYDPSQGTYILHKETMIYNPKTDSWSYETNIPEAKALGDFATADTNYIYIVSSTNTMSGYPLLSPAKTVYRLNPQTHSWTQLTDIPTGVCYKEIEILNDNYLFCIGGADANANKGYNYYQVYDITRNKWYSSTQFTLPHSYGAGVGVAKYQSNQLYITGGYSNIGSATYGALVYKFTFNLPACWTLSKTITGANSQTGSAFYFDGNTCVDTNVAANTFASSNFTVTFWFKPDDGQPAGSAMDLFGAILPDGNTVRVCLLNTGKISAMWRGSDELALTSNTVLPDGAVTNWQFIALSVYQNGTKVAGKLYVNGRADTTGQTATDTNITSLKISQAPYIGASNSNGTATSYFKGSIDDVRIYNTALADREIRYLYTNKRQSVTSVIESE